MKKDFAKNRYEAIVEEIFLRNIGKECRLSNLTCRAISAQFMDDDLIALFELVSDREEIKIAEERHYRLVPSDTILSEDLLTYAAR